MSFYFFKFFNIKYFFTDGKAAPPKRVYKFIPPSEEFYIRVTNYLEIQGDETEISPLRGMPRNDRVSTPIMVCDVPADGNCGFRALSYLLFGDEKYHWELRKCISRTQFENNEKPGVDLWPKLQHMDEQPVTKSFWMSDFDLFTFANIFEISVLLHGVNKHGRHWYCFSPFETGLNQNETFPTLCLYLANNHYQPVIGINQKA